jgi:hypothetical protein
MGLKRPLKQEANAIALDSFGRMGAEELCKR